MVFLTSVATTEAIELGRRESYYLTDIILHILHKKSLSEF